MTIADSLQKFSDDLNQCDSFIATAHAHAQNGNYLFSQLDREQITSAAFLNKFIAWECFLESSLSKLLIGEPLTTGASPKKFASPTSIDHALKMVIGVNRFFDYSNHDFMKKISRLYFDNGHPFDLSISSIVTDLNDLKTIRNSCAHMSSTTQTALESLALRIFGQPNPNITVYTLLTSADPRSSSGGTVYSEYRDKLIAAATLISHG